MYLIDTNVILDVPDVFDRYDNIFIIHDVFRELESLEYKANSELKYNIRRAKRQLKANIDKCQFIDEGECEHALGNLPNGYSETYVDNVLLAIAIKYKDTITVLTNDILLQLKLKSFGISYEHVNYQSKNYHGVYRFEYTDINATHEQENILLDLHRSKKENPLGLVEGQYLELYNTDNNKVRGIYVYQNGQYVPVIYHPIDNAIIDIKPRNTRQKLAFHLMQDNTKKVKFIEGVAGSGKDMIMLSQAFYEVMANDLSIIWLKPNKGIKDVGSIGALPGDKYDKMRDNYAQIADYLGDEFLLEEYISSGKIVIENMEFIRGRQFNNSIIYCTESQNLTEEMIKLIISRAGEGSFVYFNGDFDQSDCANGGMYCLNKLAGNPLFGKVELTEIERSEVAQLATLI